MNAPALRILVVDDEPLARARLRALLDDGAATRGERWHVEEAEQARQALGLLVQPPDGQAFQLALLDIHMPGLSGLELARQLQRVPSPPAVIFVTAHQEHALDAFDAQAADYLTKPVRLERLLQAIDKARRLSGPALAASEPMADEQALLIHERGALLRLPLADVRYFKAELKYLTVRTVEREYLMEGSLAELEERYGERFLRIHRNALVARHAMRAVLRRQDTAEGESWAVELDGVPETLGISRRMLPAVREAIARTT